jgi:hypothetical protein
VRLCHNPVTRIIHEVIHHADAAIVGVDFKTPLLAGVDKQNRLKTPFNAWVFNLV